MHLRNNPPSHNRKGGGNNHGRNRHNSQNESAVQQAVQRIIANESLLATDSEKYATSKSLYGDPTARISSNLHSINDLIRIRAYESVLKNIKGKSVLHLGCGMGLISMLAARSLASVVVAVDRSAIVEAAQVVAEKNDLRNINFFRGSLLDTMNRFPVQKFDVIICEWMGTFLVNDPLLPDAIYARDNLLAENGVMCPSSSSLHVVGVSDFPFHMDTVDYWSNVYGFSMEPMKGLVQSEVETCSIPAANIVTNTCLAHTVDIETLKTPDNGVGVNDFVVPFSVRAVRNTTVNFLTFYVDARFSNPHQPGANFVLGIRPGGKNPWTEVSVALLEPLPLMSGETLGGEVRVQLQHSARGITVVHVTAWTSGGVVALKTSGTYNYQRY
ncbi:Ribosomal protein L11 methyltransferase (PrmA) Methyltransferase small domain [Trypanosoma vivax]|uniref:Putative arginine N-methyltransferase n=1 Tax=Trypanosoma vivax (strain Y486) TaxID=1055687 RepID=G0U601_TRYVY|nr:putative arginine N-methyltransferase [Trypanosoma vivax]KAH8608217.1 Ribosomal protein L11 methyltransferase (PrmA) Methyltransferase small domain [Trypanosoma vivax]CCC51302.1 putative arginine N-methyltransferase [Trypanosoma vivax Y486]